MKEADRFTPRSITTEGAVNGITTTSQGPPFTHEDWITLDKHLYYGRKSSSLAALASRDLRFLPPRVVFCVSLCCCIAWIKQMICPRLDVETDINNIDNQLCCSSFSIPGILPHAANQCGSLQGVFECKSPWIIYLWGVQYLQIMNSLLSFALCNHKNHLKYTTNGPLCYKLNLEWS